MNLTIKTNQTIKTLSENRQATEWEKIFANYKYLTKELMSRVKNSPNSTKTQEVQGLWSVVWLNSLGLGRHTFGTR